jgi:hypothetical protein
MKKIIVLVICVMFLASCKMTYTPQQAALRQVKCGGYIR